MVPRIVLAGAAAGVVALGLAVGTFLLPLPLAVKSLLYVIFGGLFLASVAIFGRLLVIE
ncbi:hypothetical protein [Halapricum desulfuricans]|uniref:Transporter n=1 Tax=Halapricum desulfuricans TaxID=2841257 RepID=A0A897NKD9_9EURY|nr:hypothetical protein [Halapricum desulfuricans]QSG07704.1 hypothetical protein HSR122_0291 [Halapricum desulfuricans]QSG13118.1 hypothetical protein HSBGL_2720 [Halapricum desulfuricans]